MTEFLRGLARDTRAVPASVPAGLAASALTVGAVVAVVSVVIGVGLPLLAVVLAATRRLAARRRRRDGVPGRVAGPVGLRRAATDVTTWRELAWQAVTGWVVLPVAICVCLLWIGAVAAVAAPILAALPLEDPTINGRSVDSPATAWLVCAQGLVGCAVAMAAQRLLLLADARLSRSLLRPTRTTLLAGRVAELTESRADSLDAAARELRRVERDLHDGAQAQLTALTIQLGLAEQFMSEGDPARQLVAEARAGAGAALRGLRDVVHGIQPPLLVERGLPGAVRELATGAAVPVRIRVDLPQRPPAPVESALYFTVAELLTNAGRHAAATHAEVHLRRDGDTLRLTVRDDGNGGALPRPGGGLDGLRRRLAAFDGTLAVNSPAGGPTTVEVTVPCGS